MARAMEWNAHKYRSRASGCLRTRRSNVKKAHMRFQWRIKTLPYFLIAVCLALLLFLTHSIAPRGESAANLPVVWVVSGMERIGQTDQSRNTTRMLLYAARGEYEPFQVVIQAPQGGLTNVHFSVSDLYGPNNQI